jgi:hypothetical protein
MKTILALLLCAALPAFAQAPMPAPAPAKKPACAECGVVTSVRAVTKQAPERGADTKPSGLVATVPFGGGKPQVGSSTKLGREASTDTMRWEVIIRLEDGRFRVMNVDEDPEVRLGDKVRIEEGRIVPRAD